MAFASSFITKPKVLAKPAPAAVKTTIVNGSGGMTGSGTLCPNSGGTCGTIISSASVIQPGADGTFFIENGGPGLVKLPDMTQMEVNLVSVTGMTLDPHTGFFHAQGINTNLPPLE